MYQRGGKRQDSKPRNSKRVVIPFRVFYALYFSLNFFSLFFSLIFLNVTSSPDSLIIYKLLLCPLHAQTERRKTSLAMELLGTIVGHGNLDNPSMTTLAANLWNLIQRSGTADSKAMVKIASYSSCI